MELLLTTDLSLEKVAARLGFEETASFYRAFKSWTGSTPGSFRENGQRPVSGPAAMAAEKKPQRPVRPAS